MTRLFVMGLIWVSALLSQYHAYSFYGIKIPKPVTQKLDSLFPGDKVVDWAKWRGMYRADFIYHGLNVSLTFEKDGSVFKGAEEIHTEDLPACVEERIVKEYSAYKIVMATFEFKGKRIRYEVEIIRGTSHLVVTFNEKGYPLNQYAVSKLQFTGISPD